MWVGNKISANEAELLDFVELVYSLMDCPSFFTRIVTHYCTLNKVVELRRMISSHAHSNSHFFVVFVVIRQDQEIEYVTKSNF
jgi:hypothetical protein